MAAYRKRHHFDHSASTGFIHIWSLMANAQAKPQLKSPE
jgi:hypothetical protein